MASKARIFTRRFFVYANLLLVLLFLLACLVPFVDPLDGWVFGFLGLSFPFLFLLTVLFMIGWLIILKPKRALISAMALLFGWKNINVLFAFNKPRTFDMEKAPGTLRIATWNVARFIELKKNTNKGSQIRLKMFEQIKEQKADILCLQEFHTSTDTNYYNNIEPIQQLGYPYYYFSFDQDGDNHYYSSIIFSKLPFIDTARFRYPRPSLPDVLMYADIAYKGDTIRVYTTHLQSIQFGKKDYDRLGRITNGNDSMVADSRTIMGKIRKGFLRRSLQSNMAHEMMSLSPHPQILCADLNDIPDSYTYFNMRGDKQDAFLKKGFGIGRTFAGISPTLRIDYILPDNNFRILQFKRIAKKLSDHYMLVADMELK